MRKFCEGDTVRLKKTVKFSCPIERDNNSTAVIRTLMSNIPGGVIMMNDLNGCLYWNVEDLVLVKAAPRKKT